MTFHKTIMAGNRAVWMLEEWKVLGYTSHVYITGVIFDYHGLSTSPQPSPLPHLSSFPILSPFTHLIPLSRANSFDSHPPFKLLSLSRVSISSHISLLRRASPFPHHSPLLQIYWLPYLSTLSPPLLSLNCLQFPRLLFTPHHISFLSCLPSPRPVFHPNHWYYNHVARR